MSRFSRLHFLGTAATTVVAGPLGLSGFVERPSAMTGTVAQTVSDPTSIRSFQVNFSDADLDDLRKRIKATRWPERETVNDGSQGVPLEMLQGLAAYWATGYDWRKCEAKLNALPMFTTTIDGLDIQFIHVKSKHANALPLIVTHGWPGSIIEQLKIIEPLTNPTAHGGSASDAFHIVIPSIPGYGFSGKPTSPDWGTDTTARAWAVLMQRLGYTDYVAQGGDLGSVVTTLMAKQAPPGLLGINTSLPATVPPAIAKSLTCGDPVRIGGFARRIGGMASRPWGRLGTAGGSRCFRGGGAHGRRTYRGCADARRRARQHHPVLADQHGGFRCALILAE
jgi:pimeloyl-ACP methyl ester carboxylesterase